MEFQQRQLITPLLKTSELPPSYAADNSIYNPNMKHFSLFEAGLYFLCLSSDASQKKKIILINDTMLKYNIILKYIRRLLLRIKTDIKYIRNVSRGKNRDVII